MVEILRLENQGVDLIIQKDKIVISMQRVTACYELKPNDLREILYALLDSDMQ